MNPSLFLPLVVAWFGKIAGKISETINGKKVEEQQFHESMLMREYSTDLTWGSTSLDGTKVMAHVISLDSELPLTKRDTISTATGHVPKIGIKMRKSEKDITDIQLMAARGAKESEIVTKLFNDVPRVVNAVKERIEFMFLQAISTGKTIITDSENQGVAIEADFKFLDKNKFFPIKNWGASGFTPISDVKRVLDNSEGGLRYMMISKKLYNIMRTSQEAKELHANSIGLVVLSNSVLPTPTIPQFNAAFEAETGLSLIVVDRNIKFEAANGTRTTLTPFSQTACVFLQDTNVGRLVYGTLAEKTNPVASVTYQDVDTYILLSKYSKNDPLQEFTSAQALALPVIDNVDTIYLLDTAGAETDSQTEGDANFAFDGVTYTKSTVLTAAAANGVTVPSGATDAELLVILNGVSKKVKDAIKAASTVAS